MKPQPGWILSVLCVLGAGSLANAQVSSAVGGGGPTVSGIVLDDGTGKGLALVEVGLKRDGKITTPRVQTNGEGKYVIKNAPLGTATVEFRKSGYQPDPSRRKVTIAAPATSVDEVLLVATDGGPAYYQGVATRVHERASRTNEPTAVYRTEWQRLDGLPIAPTGKMIVAREIIRLDPNAQAASTSLQEYASADPGEIKRFEKRVDEAIRAGSAPESPVLPKGVIVDVTAVTLERSGAPKEAKGTFIEKFGGQFGDLAQGSLKEKLATINRGGGA